jgi:hypothetical protein
MSELQTQLRDYFDDVVERVSVQDVLSQARVRRQRTWRPVWAAATAAAVVKIGVGSVVAAYWLLGAGPRQIRSVWHSVTSVATSTSWALPVLIGVVVALAVGTAGVAVLQKKGKRMETIERTATPVVRARTVNRWLVIALAVALVLALVAIAWLLIAPPGSAVPADVQAVLDDYAAAWEAHDGATAAAMVSTFTSYDGAYTGAALEDMVNNLSEGWKATQTGPSTLIETTVGDSTVYYTIAVPEEVTYTGGSFETMSTYRLVRHGQSNQVDLLTHDTVTPLSG